MTRGRSSSMLSGRTGFAAVLLSLVVVAAVSAAGSARVAASPAGSARPADARILQEAQAGHGGEQGEEAHEEGWMPVIAKTVNFAILAGVLVYFLKTPLTEYLASRIVKVRQDLVTAAETREAAARQLTEIQAKLAALPGELEALKKRGAEEIAAERLRIQQAAEAE